MALISCRECNKEISDQAKSCPHCGCPLIELKNVDYPKKRNFTTRISSVTGSKKIVKIILILMASFLAIAFASAIHWFIQNRLELAEQQAKDEAQKKYITSLMTFSNTAILGAEKANELCDLTALVWQNTIRRKSDLATDQYTRYGTGTNPEFNSDFNTSLKNLHEDKITIQTVSDIRDNQDKVDEIYKSLQNPPTELLDYSDLAEKMYKSYIKLTDLSLNPADDLITYKDNYLEYSSSFFEWREYLIMSIPIN